jgi:hypothetical protein
MPTVVATVLPNGLTSLSLAGNLVITDESLKCVVGKNVQNLDLSGNRNVANLWATSAWWLADDTVLFALDLSHCEAVGSLCLPIASGRTLR